MKFIFRRSHSDRLIVSGGKVKGVGWWGHSSPAAFIFLNLSGIAGIQWKRHIGDGIHVTAAEQRETLLLQDNVKLNGFTACSLPVDPRVTAGNLLPLQSPSEIHIAECNPTVLMLLEAFDFV